MRTVPGEISWKDRKEMLFAEAKFDTYADTGISLQFMAFNYISIRQFDRFA